MNNLVKKKTKKLKYGLLIYLKETVLRKPVKKKKMPGVNSKS